MQLLNIKKEKEDLEKLVNSFRISTFKVLFLLLITFGETYSQDTYRKGDTYVIDTITVAGLKNFSDRTVVTYSGLREGESIQVPGEEITSILKKLWNLELFSNVDLYVTGVNNGKIKLEINVEELPTLLNYKINGVKKGKAETYEKETELSQGKRLSESFLTNTKNYIQGELRENGYLNSKINLLDFELYPNPTGSNINIFFKDYNTKDSYVTIYNPLGEVMLWSKLDGYQTLLPTKKLSSGVYIVQLFQSGKSSTKSFIKRKE